jgi:hypothetical protein
LKKLTFIAPLLLAAISPIVVYVNETDAQVFISPKMILFPCIVVSIATLVVFAFSYILIRNEILSSLIAVLFVLGVFYYWQIFLVIIICSVLCYFLLNMFIVNKNGQYKVGMAIGFVSIIIFAFYGGKFVIITTNIIDIEPTFSPILYSDQKQIPEKIDLPDIYYIILDGYGRADALQTIHGYDNSDFILELENLGFYVAPESQANYGRTFLSLASSLNMDYLDELAGEMGGSNLWWPMAGYIQQSAVRSFLEENGYKTIFFASGWDFTDIRDGDYYMHPFPIMLRDFDKAFIQLTNLRLLSGLDWRVVSFPSYDTHRQLLSYEFQTLQTVAEIPGPKFIFSHIVSPHPPFVFRNDGSSVNPDYPFSLSYAQGLFGNSESYRQSYIEQLEYINKLTFEMIEGILSNSRTSPIIIIQGDHGPGIYMDYEDVGKACLFERYSILNAFYLPGKDPNIIPEDISPVNSFRIILNSYFNTDLELLPNESYFSSNLTPYQFEDVTGLTEKPCDISPSNIP